MLTECSILEMISTEAAEAVSTSFSLSMQYSIALIDSDTRLLISSMMGVISEMGSLVSLASFLISSDTAENPLPVEPALTAS